MANPYFNPSSMFNNGWKPQGALGGALAGLQNSYAQDYADRGLRDSDQQYEMEKFKNEQIMKEAPSKESANELKMLEDQAKAEMYRDGSAQQFLRDKMASETEVGRGNAAKAITQQDEVKGKFMVEFSENLKQEDPTKLDMAYWDHWRERAKKAGVKMPPVMNDEQIARTHKNAQGYINSAEQQRARQLAADHDAAQAAKSLADRTATRTSIETEGGLNRENARVVARIGATSKETINTNTQEQTNARARERAELVRETKAVKETLEQHLVSQLRTMKKGTAEYENAVDKAMPMLYSLETKIDLNAIGEDVNAANARKKAIKDRWMAGVEEAPTSSPKSAPTAAPKAKQSQADFLKAAREGGRNAKISDADLMAAGRAKGLID